MADDDFTLDALAEYLHLDPAQVSRLAERGKVPARRLGGAWRFSRPEVHHWLESKIGLADETELARMEGALERASPPAEETSLAIFDLMPCEAIAVPLMARTKNSVINAMTELAASTGWLWDAGKMADAVRQREELHPTTLENGVALLHPRRPMVSILGQDFLALGVTPQGIPFGDSRGILTDVFFLICSTNDSTHLRMLARLSRLLASADLLSELRAAENAASVRDLFIEREQSLLG